MSSSVPAATPNELMSLTKPWTITSDGILVFYDNLDPTASEEVGEVDAVIFVERRVGDKVLQCLRWFVPSTKAAYTVDWKFAAFTKTGTAPRLHTYARGNIKTNLRKWVFVGSCMSGVIVFTMKRGEWVKFL